MSQQENEVPAAAQREMSLHTSQEVGEYMNMHGPFLPWPQVSPIKVTGSHKTAKGVVSELYSFSWQSLMEYLLRARCLVMVKT